MNSDPGELSVYAGHYYFGNSVSAIDKNGPPAVTYSGLGIDFGMEDGLAKVRSVFTGGPAAQAGIEPDASLRAAPTRRPTGQMK